MSAATDIILIKTSSLGDVLHNLPVVADIRAHRPDAQIDWVVEESFAALPALHPHIRRVIPVALRRWRKQCWQARGEIRAAIRELRRQPYQIALDTQGLLKSALITRCIHAERFGYDWGSACEPLSSLFYTHRFRIEKSIHAVERNRLLAGAALGYQPQGEANYGIHSPDLALPWLPDNPYVVFLHATSRDEKLWDEPKWISLGTQLHRAGLRVILPWGNEKERARSERLGAAIADALCPPRLSIAEAAAVLGQAQAVVGVDTGLSHLAAALGTPVVGLYVATHPGLTGLHGGNNAINLGGKNQSPDVEAVKATLSKLGLHV